MVDHAGYAAKQYCWNAMGPSVDHVVERRNGGDNFLENLRLAHQKCNNARRELYPHTAWDAWGNWREWTRIYSKFDNNNL